MQDYYVYHHLNPETGKVFYVGKGRGYRAYQKDKRSKHWQRYVAKHGIKVEIVRKSMTEAQALDAERAEIARIGLDRLVNHLPGGGPQMSRFERIAYERAEIIDGLKRAGLQCAAWIYLGADGQPVREVLYS